MYTIFVTISIVLRCFLQTKFFNATVKKNILKGKTSYKGNVKLGFLLDPLLCLIQSSYVIIFQLELSVVLISGQP
jgi:hypothetical protein